MATVLAPPCMCCGKSASLELTDSEFESIKNWKAGFGPRFIQDVLPEWSPDRRELLISGTHPECWDAMFGDDEDEDDDEDGEEEELGEDE